MSTKTPTKKKKIPASIRGLVWDKYMGADFKKGKCYCCKNEQITFTNFHCGHYISEKNGGLIKVNNLRPICMSCNLSMGTMNMDDYMEEYGINDSDDESTKIKLKTVDEKEFLFKKISDRYVYYICGETKIICDKKNGYFNATHLCKNAKKDFFSLVRLKSFNKIIEKKTKELNIKRNDIIKILISGTNKELYGSYIHHTLMKPVITWLDSNIEDEVHNVKWSTVSAIVSDME